MSFSAASLLAKRTNKYRAVRTVVDGRSFHSKREAVRYGELRLLERATEITDLRMQVRYPLMGANGTIVAYYVADFDYMESIRKVIEDTKGLRTQLFNLKWKLMHDNYPDISLRLV